MEHDLDNRQFSVIILSSSSFDIWQAYIMYIECKQCSHEKHVHVKTLLISILKQIVYGHIFYFNLNYI